MDEEKESINKNTCSIICNTLTLLLLYYIKLLVNNNNNIFLIIRRLRIIIIYLGDNLDYDVVVEIIIHCCADKKSNTEFFRDHPQILLLDSFDCTYEVIKFFLVNKRATKCRADKNFIMYVLGCNI